MRFRLTLLLILLSALAACTGDSNDATSPEPVAVVEITPLTIPTLTVGDTMRLAAVTRDAHGNVLSGRIVAWSTADGTVATVSNSGLVTAVGAGGPIQITATSEGKTRSVSVSVTAAVKAVAAIIVAPAYPDLGVGESQRLVAIAIDSSGAVMPNQQAQWSSSTPGASVSATGVVTANAVSYGVITATIGTKSGIARLTIRSINTDPVQTLLNDLSAHIASSLASNQDLLPRNPTLALYIQAKIDMLQRPALETEIRQGQLYESGSVASIDGRSLGIGAVFPLDTMRAGAHEGVALMASGARALEQFLDVPFPTNKLHMWYGFTLGNSGGGGYINMEDKGTYVSRPPSTKLEFDPIYVHELGHSYIPNESLNQFLEIYGYNKQLGRTDDASTWTSTRGWVPNSSSNTGVAAVLDLYQMLGRAAMANAYRMIYTLVPPYGTPVSAEVQQAFVNNAPADLRAAVAAKAAKIGQ